MQCGAAQLLLVPVTCGIAPQAAASCLVVYCAGPSVSRISPSPFTAIQFSRDCVNRAWQ